MEYKNVKVECVDCGTKEIPLFQQYDGDVKRCKACIEKRAKKTM